MKKCLSKTIALLLCAVMLCSNLTGVTVFAETAEENAPVETVEAQVPAAQETLPEAETIPQETVVETEPAVTEPVVEIAEEDTAEETVPMKEETSAVRNPASKEIVEDEEGFYTFTTFEDLKAMAADRETYRYAEWKYAGTEPFVFEESIDLSDTNVYFEGASVTVPEGVTVMHAIYICASDLVVEGCVNVDVLDVMDGKVVVTGTLNASDLMTDYRDDEAESEILVEGTMSCNALRVEDKLKVTGTLNVADVFVVAGGKLEVTGTVNVFGNMEVLGSGEINGIENIDLKNEWSSINHSADVNDFAKLKAFLAKASLSTCDREIFEVTWFLAENAVLQESLTIPDNCKFEIYGYDESDEVGRDVTFTVAEGVTFTNNGEISVRASNMLPNFCVEGTLENNGYLHVFNERGAILSMKEGSRYAGRGELSVSSEREALSEILVGVELDDFQIEKDSCGNFFEWFLTYVGDLTQLAAPTELQWGYGIESEYDEETGKWIAAKAEGMPGMFCWKNTPPYDGVVEVACYLVGEGWEEQILCYKQDYTVYDQAVYYYDYDQSLLYGKEYDSLQSGDYYFTVTNKGDGVETRDSETATSEIWTYVKPETAMSGCTDPVWDGDTISWTGPKDGEKYMIEVYHTASADEEPEHIGSYSWVKTPEASVSTFFKGCGPGYYYARIRTLSANIEEKCHSQWSELSEPYYYAAPTSGSCGDDLTWRVDEENGILTISGTGDMYDYTFSGAPWFPLLSNSEVYVDTVVVEKGVTGIGDNAFGLLQNIRNITLPDGLKTIGQAAFENTSIQQITIPDSVTTIRKFAFWNCNVLARAVIPNGVASLGERVFNNCYSLGTVTIGSGVKEIHSGAFKWCEGLQSVLFLGDAPAIAADAFPEITTTCYYPSDNNTWTADVQQNYGGRLTWDTLAAGDIFLVAGGEYAESLYWTMDSVGTVAITGDGTMEDHGPISTPWDWHDVEPYRVRKVIVGGGVENIGSNSFESLEELKRVEVEAGVSRVDIYGFIGCNGLEEVVFRGDAPEFDSRAFWKTTTTCYYPAGNETWAGVAGEQYGGELTWVAYYSVLEGADATVSVNDQDHKIRVDGELSRFESVRVDEKLVDPANYTVTEGSTVITFRAEFLATLAKGEHTVTITFTDGVATTGLTVAGDSIPGDLNGDDSVNDDDVILLLWHTLLPELYPVEGEADFTADGNVNDEDVIYLLWHTLIPELYPL